MSSKPTRRVQDQAARERGVIGRDDPHDPPRRVAPEVLAPEQGAVEQEAREHEEADEAEVELVEDPVERRRALAGHPAGPVEPDVEGDD